MAAATVLNAERAMDLIMRSARFALLKVCVSSIFLARTLCRRRWWGTSSFSGMCVFDWWWAMRTAQMLSIFKREVSCRGKADMSLKRRFDKRVCCIA